MLRMAPLTVYRPESLEEAVALLAKYDGAARVIAGGTDVLPALKLRRIEAQALVSLSRVPLGGVDVIDGQLRLGAGLTLFQLAGHADVQRIAPALAHAAGRIAAPQIRHMGTLAGNLCLDTRCRYVNRSDLWREALGGCLKSTGDTCWVVPGGKSCVAAMSADTVPVLVAMGATVDILGSAGPRTIDVQALYSSDGINHLTLAPSEVITAVIVPVPADGTRFGYRKWAVRKAIDFPLVSACVRLDIEGDVMTGGEVVVGVLGPRPKRVDLKALAGTRLGAELAAQIGARAYKRCRPLPNVPYDPEYRRERLAVEVKRAAFELME